MSAAPAISAEFTEASKANFRLVLAEVSRTFRKTAPEVIKWACIKFLTSARSHTKVSRKLRDTRDTAGTLAAAAHPMQMEVWAQGWTAPKWYGITGSADPARIIERRGAARNSWNRCFHDVGKLPPPSTGYQPDVSGATRHFEGDMPYAILWNRLSYLPIIHPTIGQETLDRVTRQFVARLDREVKKALATGVRKAITV